MPVTNLEMQSWPAWSELEQTAIVNIAPGHTLHIEKSSERMKLVVVRGDVQIDGVNHGEGEVIEATGDIDVTSGNEPAVVVPLHGHWGNVTGGCGVFSGSRAAEPENRGTPVDYDRSTSFDNHYHDCDEYWIFVEGEAVAASEGTFFHVQPGDVVITGAGDHHDLPEISAPIRAVYFETTLIGEKRTGHLWEHTHGKATPVRR
jgi:mannose-6-phosphate isomerase-like protein (cupin superfamily)